MVIGVNEDDKSLLIETSERAKSNTHQIEEIKSDIKDIKQEQKTIYELTSSVKVMADNLIHIQEDVKEIKQGQTDLSNKVDNQIKEIKTDVDSRVSSVNDKINKIDDEGKFNIREWISKNWVALALGLSALVYFGSQIFQNMPSVGK